MCAIVSRGERREQSIINKSASRKHSVSYTCRRIRRELAIFPVLRLLTDHVSFIGREDDSPMQTVSTSDSSVSYNQSPSDLQLQILRLQTIQQELQVQMQMQMLQNQAGENAGNQTNSVDSFITQLQQRQHTRGNDQLSPRHQSTDNNYMRQRSSSTDVSSPQAYRMPSSTRTSVSSVDYSNEPPLGQHGE